MKHSLRLSEADLPTYDGVRPAWPGEHVAGLHVRRGPRRPELVARAVLGMLEDLELGAAAVPRPAAS